MKDMFRINQTVTQKLFGDDAGLYDTMGKVVDVNPEENCVKVVLRADVARIAYFDLDGIRFDSQAWIEPSK